MSKKEGYSSTNPLVYGYDWTTFTRGVITSSSTGSNDLYRSSSSASGGGHIKLESIEYSFDSGTESMVIEVEHNKFNIN